MTNGDEATLVRSIISREAPTPREVLSRLGDDRTQLLFACAMSVALERKFPESPTAAGIEQFTKDLQQRFPSNAAEIKPQVVDALIRTTEGEQGLLDEHDRDDLMSMEYLITYAIISELMLTETQVEQYTTEVLAMAGV
jgi:hypothetical protein